ncbi:MAG: hypothetical protein GF341_12685 [candidate division Zixibacteria bacterium]|nr:hypothetical protein [candidate division Zixibacteria bacterium]
MRQRYVVFLAVIALLLLATVVGAQNPTFIRGDVNADNVVDGVDVTELQGYLFGGTIACEFAADVNDDGIANTFDLSYLTDYVNSGGSEPPAPFPNCGEDPTSPQAGTSCCEPAQPVVPENLPSMTGYGAGVLVLLMIVAAVVIWRKKQSSVHA